jgi:hypothetical protein
MSFTSVIESQALTNDSDGVLAQALLIAGITVTSALDLITWRRSRF